MQLPIVSLFAGFAAIAFAQQSGDNPFKINGRYEVTAGEPSTIQWTPTTQGPVRLTLRSGASSDLNKGTVIAQSIPNSGSYTFTLPEDTTRNSDYTLEIAPVSDPSKMNYTPQFVVESSNTVASTTGSESNSASATSATSRATSGSSSATRSASSMTSSASMSSSRTASSSMSSSTASATESAAESAPSDGAASKNGLYVQAGMAAVLMGVAALW